MFFMGSFNVSASSAVSSKGRLCQVPLPLLLLRRRITLDLGCLWPHDRDEIAEESLLWRCCAWRCVPGRSSTFPGPALEPRFEAAAPARHVSKEASE